ncbi:MAG: peptide/nickel transport system ATP-binding protein [Myxococcota bacterium]|jgi:peptide/nickel transport system ATP-binding protein
MSQGLERLLTVTDLCVDYITPAGPVRAVESVSFNVDKGEIFGLAGESGSGKSTLIHALLRTLGPPGVISGGHVDFEGADVLGMDDETLRRFRWRKIAMVFQSALNALNPVATVGEQIIDTIAAHEPVSKADGVRRARELLDLVGIDPDRVSSYPHQLSGGMRQRVGIAIGLVLQPPLLIMDEPTTALDVVVEKRILGKIMSLKRELGFSILFITHDLPLMLEISDRIGILYAGRLVEVGPAKVLRANATHPYTQGLMKAFPDILGPKVPLTGIPGTPPSLANPPSGCRFHPRCAFAMNICRTTEPALISVADNHRAACHLTEMPGS